MDIIEKLKWRYACKKFDQNKKLNTGQLNKLKEAFNLTATSFGLQPVKLLILENQELKNKLLPHAYHQQKITTCSHLLVLCIDTDINDSSVDHYFDLVKKTRNTPENIIGGFRDQLKGIFKNSSPDDLERSAINQAYIILGNLMTVCAIEHIDACPMEGFNAQKFDEILNLSQKKLKSVLLLPVGIRSKDDFMSTQLKVRKSLQDIVFEI